MVSWFSINLLLEDSSIRNSWTLFNSSISWKLLIWASRRSRFFFHSCSWNGKWSRRDCSSLAIVWYISLRWDSIIPFNSWILLLSESAWNSCFWISVLTSARICSFLSFKENPDSFVFPEFCRPRTRPIRAVIYQWFQLIPGYFFCQNRLEIRASGSRFWLQRAFAFFCLSRRILILLFSMSRPDFRFFETNQVCFRVSPYLCVRKRTELATNFLHESDKIVSGSLVLLALEWTVVKIALFRQAHRRVPYRTSTTVPNLCRRIHPGRSLQKSLSSRSCRAAWAYNLWEDYVSPRSNTSHSAGAQ